MRSQDDHGALRQRVVGAPLQPVAGRYLGTGTLPRFPKSWGWTPCHPKFDEKMMEKIGDPPKNRGKLVNTHGFGDPYFKKPHI